jgi:protein required for attachment to host cells
MSMWILVCDASRAVVYSAEERGKDWRTVGSYSHPESRMKNSELTPTEPGHSLKSKGDTRHTVMETSTSPKDAEKAHFAQQLAEVMNDGANKQSFDGFVLVAPPHFTGLIEQHLSAEARKKATATVHKDYANIDAREARQRLEDTVFARPSHRP